MKVASVAGRLVLASGDGAVDVADASGGLFGPDIAEVYPRWAEFEAWARNLREGPVGAIGSASREPGSFGPPSPRPGQIFAIGLNYRAHADETGRAHPDDYPVVFTKFATSLSGPVTSVTLPHGGTTDWEVELVVVIGKSGHRIDEAAAWSHVAGVTVGQDLSERRLQRSGPVPQFSMGKSYPGFAPTGPWLVTPDEFDDPDDLELACWIDDERMQHGRTRDMIYPVPRLIHLLSQVTPLRPGDLIFTGTPDGVGIGRTPPRFLRAGERLRSRIEGIGELEQTFAEDPDPVSSPTFG
jgi:2-keto-4-pentenoate hydratase/2-oxohepta-3-ene-1,7-dioic acid hydratase in catechol pathway